MQQLSEKQKMIELQKQELAKLPNMVVVNIDVFDPNSKYWNVVFKLDDDYVLRTQCDTDSCNARGPLSFYAPYVLKAKDYSKSWKRGCPIQGLYIWPNIINNWESFKPLIDHAYADLDMVKELEQRINRLAQDVTCGLDGYGETIKRFPESEPAAAMLRKILSYTTKVTSKNKRKGETNE